MSKQGESKVPGVVQLEVGQAIEEALARGTELFDSDGDRIEDFDYIAQVALSAAYLPVHHRALSALLTALQGEVALLRGDAASVIHQSPARVAALHSVADRLQQLLDTYGGEGHGG